MQITIRQKLKRAGLIALTMIVLIIAVPLVWYQVSVQPGAAALRYIFERGPAVHAGPGVPLERPEVQVTADIPVIVDAVFTTQRSVNPNVDSTAKTPDASINIHAPRTAEPGSLPVILWIHGGGFVANSAADLAGYANILADAGYVVVVVDYTLAPGAHYPTPLIQANAALAWITEHIDQYGGDATRVSIGGDSAGAQLTSQLAVIQTDPEYAAQVGIVPALDPAHLRSLVLFCGFYDIDSVVHSGFPALRTFFWAYTGQRDWQKFERAHELSTLQHVTGAYPPTFIAVGDADPFNGQGRELAATLEALGVAVTTNFWADAGLGHEYQFDFRLEEARQTLEHTLNFLQENA